MARHGPNELRPLDADQAPRLLRRVLPNNSLSPGPGALTSRLASALAELADQSLALQRQRGRPLRCSLLSFGLSDPFSTGQRVASDPPCLRPRSFLQPSACCSSRSGSSSSASWTRLPELGTARPTRLGASNSTASPALLRIRPDLRLMLAHSARRLFSLPPSCSPRWPSTLPRARQLSSSSPPIPTLGHAPTACSIPSADPCVSQLARLQQDCRLDLTASGSLVVWLAQGLLLAALVSDVPPTSRICRIKTYAILTSLVGATGQSQSAHDTLSAGSSCLTRVSSVCPQLLLLASALPSLQDRPLRPSHPTAPHFRSISHP